MEDIVQNMNLQELSRLEGFGSFIKYVCEQNNLLDLKSILEYQKDNNNFFSLDYCSKDVNRKLMEVCAKYKQLIVNLKCEIISSKKFIQEKKDEINGIPNYSLEELSEREKLNIRAHNSCKYFNLNTLKDLIHFYDENGNFLKVRNCGRKSNDELISICKKYKQLDLQASDNKFGLSKYTINEVVVINKLKFKTLFELAIEDKLSQRTQNICQSNKLDNLYLILIYYVSNKDFLGFQNCGKESNAELIRLCKKYLNIQLSTKIQNSDDSNEIVVSQIDNLSTKQKAVLNNFIYLKYSKLTIRSKNGLSNLLQNSITIGTIKNEIYANKYYNVEKIRNVGELSEQEITHFFLEVKELIELVL